MKKGAIYYIPLQYKQPIAMASLFNAAVVVLGCVGWVSATASLSDNIYHPINTDGVSRLLNANGMIGSNSIVSNI